MFSIVIGTLFVIILSFVFGSFYVIIDKTISVKKHDQTCIKMKWHDVNIAFMKKWKKYWALH
jgi:hypothetical protein